MRPSNRPRDVNLLCSSHKLFCTDIYPRKPRVPADLQQLHLLTQAEHQTPLVCPMLLAAGVSCVKLRVRRWSRKPVGKLLSYRDSPDILREVLAGLRRVTESPLQICCVPGDRCLCVLQRSHNQGQGKQHSPGVPPCPEEHPLPADSQEHHLYGCALSQRCV